MLSLENVFDDCTCRQHWFFVDVKHALEPVCFFGLVDFTIFLPRLRWVWPSISLRFLFRLYATTGGFSSAAAVLLLVWSMGQWAFIILWMGGW